MDITAEKRKAALRRPSHNALISLEKFGAGEGIRTLDPNLGKVALSDNHQSSYPDRSLRGSSVACPSNQQRMDTGCLSYGFIHLFDKGGSTPLDPDGVPPLSFALRGGSPLYHSRRTVNSADFSAADAALGTDKIGVWGLRPQRGPGAEPLAFLLPCLTYLSAYGAEPWPYFFPNSNALP